ncbi:MAG: hypothetical protein JWO80_4568 [Bryobacterales bacterium]|nr:hypothetical protein [Bryobacterales bacterium]
MPAAIPTKRVEENVSKVNDEIAVGSDLEFQRKWWRIERTLWVVLAALLVFDVPGCFGRGSLANAEEVGLSRAELYSARELFIHVTTGM